MQSVRWVVARLPGRPEGSAVVPGEIGSCNVAKELTTSSMDDVRGQGFR